MSRTSAALLALLAAFLALSCESVQTGGFESTQVSKIFSSPSSSPTQWFLSPTLQPCPARQTDVWQVRSAESESLLHLVVS